jgi:hypothetical protein
MHLCRSNRPKRSRPTATTCRASILDAMQFRIRDGANRIRALQALQTDPSETTFDEHDFCMQYFVALRSRQYSREPGMPDTFFNLSDMTLCTGSGLGALQRLLLCLRNCAVRPSCFDVLRSARSCVLLCYACIQLPARSSDRVRLP